MHKQRAKSLLLPARRLTIDVHFLSESHNYIERHYMVRGHSCGICLSFILLVSLNIAAGPAFDQGAL